MASLTADDDRCTRNDGRKWRCSLPRIVGSRYCEKHYIHYIQKNAKANAMAKISNPIKEEKGLAQGDARVSVSSPLPALKKKQQQRGRVGVSETTIAKKEMSIGDDDLGIRVRVSNPVEKKRKGGRPPKAVKKGGVNNVRVYSVKKEKFIEEDPRVRVSNPVVGKKRKRGRPSGEWKERANIVRVSNPSIVKKERPNDEVGYRADRVGAFNLSVEIEKKRGRISKKKKEANSVRVSKPLIMKKEMPIEQDGTGAARVGISNSLVGTKKKRGRPSMKKEEANSVRVSEPSIMNKKMPIEEDDFVARVRVSNPPVVRKKRGRISNARKKERAKLVRVSDLLTGKKHGRPYKTNKDEGKKSVRNEISGEDDEESLRVLELGQVWAFPKGSDRFPRHYARIDRIVPKSTGTIAIVTELVPQPVSVEEVILVEQGLSLGCGPFKASQSTLAVNIFYFTHKVPFEKEDNEGSFYKIFPKTGEIWAMYLKWDNLKKGFEYKLVEVVSDFNEKDGVNVFGLVRVEGRDGVYQRQVRQGFYLIRNCSRSFMPVFSHQVPASRVIEDGDIIWKVTLH